MNEIIELHNKLFYYLDTFSVNEGRKVAHDIIFDCLKKDAVEEKMRSLRCTSLYEKGAREYYNKYGTVGEF